MMMGKRENKAYQACVRAALLFCCAMMLGFFILPAKTLALNSDYMNPDKWNDHPNTVTYAIEYENLGNTLSGYFSYFTDDHLGIYTYFAISETTLTEETDFVSVTYAFHMPDEEFSLTLDRNGLAEDNDPEERSEFLYASDFSTLGTYLSAAQYAGREYSSCTVDITLSVNGHNYRITENDALYGNAIPMEIPTTERITTTKAVTTKKNVTTTEKSTGTAQKTESSAKFKPRYSITTKAKQQTRAGGTEAAEERAEESESVPQETESTAETSAYYESLTTGKANSKMSKPAKILLIIGIVFAAAGISVLLTAAGIKGKPDAEHDSAEKEK